MLLLVLDRVPLVDAVRHKDLHQVLVATLLVRRPSLKLLLVQHRLWLDAARRLLLRQSQRVVCQFQCISAWTDSQSVARRNLQAHKQTVAAKRCNHQEVVVAPQQEPQATPVAMGRSPSQARPPMREHSPLQTVVVWQLVLRMVHHHHHRVDILSRRHGSNEDGRTGSSKARRSESG